MQAGRGEGWRRAWEPQGGDPGVGRVARAVGESEGVKERGGRGREVGGGGEEGTWGQRKGKGNQSNKD